MNTVIKGTKTIAEYKRVREDMENLARANYARHKEALTVWDSRKKFQPWDDCSITKPKPKHAASLTLH